MQLRKWFAPLVLAKAVCLPSSLLAKKRTLHEFGFQITGQEVNLNQTLPSNRLTFQIIKKESTKFKNYPGFLDYLEEQYPDFFDNFVLMHRSGSLQKASLNKPRVLSFSDGMVLGFSEQEEESDKHQVEIIEFNGNSFDFHEIVFKKDEVEFVTNPPECKACHGDPARPIWKPFDFWPNAYISSSTGFSHPTEKKHFEAFKSRSKHGIYGKLRYKISFGAKDTEVFTQYLSQLNNIAIANALQSKKDQLLPFLPAILSILSQCYNSDSNLDGYLSKLIPSTVVEGASRDLAFFMNETSTYNKNYLLKLNREYQSIFALNTFNARNRNHRPLQEDKRIGLLRFLFENLGFNWQEFQMSQGMNRFMSSTPLGFSKDFQTSMYLFAPEAFKNLGATVIQKPHYDWYEFDCNELEQKSKSYLQDAAPDTLNQLVPRVDSLSSRTPIGDCIACHTENPIVQPSSAPVIPFDEQTQMRQWIKEYGLDKLKNRILTEGAKKMPPNRELSAEEKQRLILVFESLSK